MTELSFVAGIAIGIAVAGFGALGAFERGAASVRNAPWRRELLARHALSARRAPALRAVPRRIEQEARSIAS